MTSAFSRRALRSFIFLSLLALGAYAPDLAFAKASQFTLQNGLRIVVVPDHRAPVVTHMVWYRVGGVDDPPGLSGIAHFFEHLMFKGTKKTPPGEFSKTVARNGGQDNAFTSHDFTAYFQRIAKDRLPLVMELEADRMSNLDLSENNVRTEREVVREERHFRVDSDPSAQVREQMEAALHLSHPYGRPVIGWDSEIQRIGRAEALDFYRHHYAPNNAILVVVGDVNPEDVRRLAEAKFGPVPARTLASRPEIAQPPRLAESRIAVSHADAKLPTWMRLYRVPSYTEATPGVAESLDVLASILGGGATSRLYKTLVIDKKLAVTASAWYSGAARDAAEFGVYAVPRDGVTFAQLETAIDEVIRGMAAAPPEAGEFARAKTKLVADWSYGRDSQSTMANEYGAALAIGLTVEDVEDWPNRIKRVGAGDVRRSAQTYLVKKEAVTGLLSPRRAP